MALFKAYDIRGIVPDELDAEKAYAIGRATAHFIGAGPIVVGRDARVHSPSLTTALIDGTHAEAIDADIGLLRSLGARSTPTFFVSGRIIEGAVPEDVFVVAIEDALERAEEALAAGAEPGEIYDAVQRGASTEPVYRE